MPDFDFNEFLSERLKKESDFDFKYLLIGIKKIERFLFLIYTTYKNNPKDYNKLIEIEQKMDRRIFFREKPYREPSYIMFEFPHFDKLYFI